MSFFGLGNQSLQIHGTETLKDWAHASKTFLSNGYQLVPRYKFLFHVYFNLNTSEIPQLAAAYGSGNINSIGLMVKSVELPKFKIDTQVLNQYNRKRVTQSKIHYEPARIVFHDDQSDLIRRLWYNYFSYYYKDPSEPYNNVSATSGSIGQIATVSNGFSYNTSDIYSPSLLTTDWGYIGESPTDGTSISTNSNGKPAFFRDITIYGLSQKKYSAWTLINPMISSWDSDSYDYNDGGGTLSNTVSIEYETVKYYSGAIGGEHPSATASGFSDPPHYDVTPSPISTSIGRNTVFAQGGLVSAVAGTIQDLQAVASGQGGLPQVIGAVQQASTVYNTFRNANVNQSLGPAVRGALPQAALNLLQGSLQATANSPNGMIFPTAGTTPGGVSLNGNGFLTSRVGFPPPGV
jgi:hypothetical protein